MWQPKGDEPVSESGTTADYGPTVDDGIDVDQGPLHSLKLDRARTIAQADSSPAAEDEQGGPSLVDDE